MFIFLYVYIKIKFVIYCAIILHFGPLTAMTICKL